MAVVVLSLVSTGCIARVGDDPGIREGVVHMRDGVPCFGVRNDAETREGAAVVAEVSVYQRKKGESELVWRTSYVPDGGEGVTRLAPGECISYSGGIGSHGSGLSPGKMYVAMITGAVRAKGQSHVRSYESFFCLSTEADVLLVRQIPRNHHSDPGAWRACRIDTDG